MSLSSNRHQDRLSVTNIDKGTRCLSYCRGGHTGFPHKQFPQGYKMALSSFLLKTCQSSRISSKTLSVA